MDDSSWSGYAELEHTADLALRVRGIDLADLFCQAARGMVSLMDYRPHPSAQRVEHLVTLAAIDVETLLVDWLSEVLYWAESCRIALVEFEMHAMDDQNLRARIAGAAPAAPQRGIKAVTFADLHIEHTSQGLQTILTFDV